MTYISSKDIIIAYMKCNKSDKMTVHDACNIFDYINIELELSGKTDDYSISSVNEYSIGGIVEYNSDIFEIDPDKEYIRLRNTNYVNEINVDNLVSDEIYNIIKRFTEGSKGKCNNGN